MSNAEWIDLGKERAEADRFVEGQGTLASSYGMPFERMTVCNADRIDDILNRFPEGWFAGSGKARDSYDQKEKVNCRFVSFDEARKASLEAFDRVMANPEVDTTVRLKIASKLLEDKSYAGNWAFVGQVMDLANSVETPQGPLFETLSKQLIGSVKSYDQALQSAKEDLQTKQSSCDDYQTAMFQHSRWQDVCQGDAIGENLIRQFRTHYQKIVESGENPDKPVIAQEQAEAYIMQALQGKAKAIPPVKKGLSAWFSAEERARIERQNQAVKEFNAVLAKAGNLPDVEKTSHVFQEAMVSDLQKYGKDSEKVPHDDFRNAMGKQMLWQFSGKILADSTLKECHDLQNKHADVAKQHRHPDDLKLSFYTGAERKRSQDRIDDLQQYNLLAKMKTYRTKFYPDLEKRQQDLNTIGLKPEDMKSRKDVMNKTTTPPVRGMVGGRD